MQFDVNEHEYIFFKDKKIARARRASAICSLKNLQVLITPNCKGNHVITCYNVREKTLQKVKTDEILRACANYFYFALVLQLSTCVMNLHSCYMRMHSFSANQKRVIFSRTLLIKLLIYNTYLDYIRVKLFV